MIFSSTPVLTVFAQLVATGDMEVAWQAADAMSYLCLTHSEELVQASREAMICAMGDVAGVHRDL